MAVIQQGSGICIYLKLNYSQVNKSMQYGKADVCLFTSLALDPSVVYGRSYLPQDR